MTESVRTEFGDFQTPAALAFRVTQLLAQRGLSPSSVLEPTCGVGAFVEASLNAWPSVNALLACDVNPDYVGKTRALASMNASVLRCEVANFFEHDWDAVLKRLSEPTLIIGNPPWVTASELGSLGSANLPRKENFQNRRGLDALTGKSNFDVAEWMLIRLLEAAQGRDVTIAMLVKTSVARRVLAHAWRTALNAADAEMLMFDAGKYFGVSADACLFLCTTAKNGQSDCLVGELDKPERTTSRVGWRDGFLVADSASYDRFRSVLLDSSERSLVRWRSGVKHDCATVMELRRVGHAFVDAQDQPFEIEPDYVYPLFKGTDLIKGNVRTTTRWLLVTQAQPGDDTSVIARRAPLTWEYLCRRGVLLDARRSSIYKNRPRFSVFGVGPYTFAPWKVAISALHKKLCFAVVGPVEGRPAVFDDTCYHLSFETEAAASFVQELLSSEPSTRLLESMIFWDAKRPITAEVLQRLSIEKTARYLGRGSDFAEVVQGVVRAASPQSSFDFESGIPATR